MLKRLKRKAREFVQAAVESELLRLEAPINELHAILRTQNSILSASLPAPEFWSSPNFDRESHLQHLQRSIMNQWIEWKVTNTNPLNNLSEAGFRAYSEFEEDGIILYLLTMTGFTTGIVVEMCCGDGRECMATNLVVNHGFKGYLFDGDAKNIEAAGTFFNAKHDCRLFKPTIRHCCITRENVNQLLEESGVSGEVDLLALDIDGNDYWIWDAMEAISPRICVFETHNIIPLELALTIRYEPQFRYSDHAPEKYDYRSVSLAGMVKLSAKKGYRLIGGHRHGFNVFFMRNDIAPDLFPEVPAEVIHNNYWTRNGQRERWPAVKELDWVMV